MPMSCPFMPPVIWFLLEFLSGRNLPNCSFLQKWKKMQVFKDCLPSQGVPSEYDGPKNPPAISSTGSECQAFPLLVSSVSSPQLWVGPWRFISFATLPAHLWGIKGWCCLHEGLTLLVEEDFILLYETPLNKFLHINIYVCISKFIFFLFYSLWYSVPTLLLIK